MKAKKVFNLTSVRPSPLDEKDINFHITRFVSIEAPLPIVFKPYNRPVRNQGRHGSCVGFAAAEALQYANDMKKSILKQPEQTEKEIYFRSFVVNGSLANKPKILKKIYVLVDGHFEYWSEAPGIVACKIPKDIVDKGLVRVQVWAEGYKYFRCID